METGTSVDKFAQPDGRLKRVFTKHLKGMMHCKGYGKCVCVSIANAIIFSFLWPLKPYIVVSLITHRIAAEKMSVVIGQLFKSYYLNVVEPIFPRKRHKPKYLILRFFEVHIKGKHGETQNYSHLKLKLTIITLCFKTLSTVLSWQVEIV